MSEIELKEFSVKENKVSLGGLQMGVEQVGGITHETDPTVPQWAKQPNKPTYDYSEIENTPDLNKYAEKETLKDYAKTEELNAVRQEVEAVDNKANEAKETADEAKETAESVQETANQNKSDISSLNTEVNGLKNALPEYAKKTEVKQEISDLINSAPETLDTLGEIAKAIQDNEEVVDVLNQAVGEKASKTELQQVDQKTTNNATAIEEVNQRLNDDYVKNTDVAGNLKLGLVASGENYYGFLVTPGTGLTRTKKWTLEEYKKQNDFYFMGKGTLENIKNDYIKRGITENDITLTAEEKANALAWLGASSTKWYKHNIFVNIQNVTYYNMQIITTSQTAIEHNGNGLVIQGAVIGVMYYGVGGSTSNELQHVGILLPFAETYYPTIIDFGTSGFPQVKNFIGDSFFPSDVTEFIDTPTEL